MHTDKVVLDRESFKALSSETRISVLKALYGKRMTITQLSDTLNVSKPALLKHMDALIEAKLVSKEEKERKWIYYDLTFKGKNVVHPERIAVTVLLSTAIVSIAGAIVGFLKYLLGSGTTLTGTGGKDFGTESLSPPPPGGSETSFISSDPTMLYIGIALLIIFSVLLAVAIIIKKKYAKPRI